MNTRITPLHPHLESLLSIAESIPEVALHLTDGLSKEQLYWRPAPEQWSIAHCFDHLVVTGNLYYSRVRKAIDEDGAPDERWIDEEYQPSWFGKWFVHATGPETRARIRSRGIFEPSATPSPRVIGEFCLQQNLLTGLIRDASGHNLRRIKIHSPLSRFLTLSLGECLEMLVVHQQRHLLQVRRVLESPGLQKQGGQAANGTTSRPVSFPFS